MKKLVISILVLFALLSMQTQAQDTIMVIADPHVLPQTEIAQETNFENYMAKQRKMVDLSEPIWKALMDTAMKYKPSLVLIPGDLTRDGEPAAHDTVSAALERLQQAGIRTLVIPGNHDLPATVAWENLYSGTFENAVKDPNSFSYAVEPLPGVTVIGIDGSNGNAGTGVLKPGTLQFVLAQADSAVAKGHMIIAMSHWQILEHFDKKSTLESSCRFKNADALRDSLMAHGVHLVLTGHFHVNSISTWHDEIHLTDSIVEISTGSPITFPCPYRWLTISEDRAMVDVATEYITALDTIADLYTYSRAWMAEHTYNLIPSLAPRMWNKVDEYKSKIVNDYGSMVKAMCLFFGDLGAEIDNAIPSTDSARVDLVQRHIGKAVVDLYLFHSEANENERPALADSLTQAVYDGMQNMMIEVVTPSEVLSCMADLLLPMAQLMAEGPVQSLAEDITQRNAVNENRTDDLHPTLVINAPLHQDLNNPTIISDSQLHAADKFLHDGRLYIRYDDRIFNTYGQQVQ